MPNRKHCDGAMSPGFAVEYKLAGGRAIGFRSLRCTVNQLSLGASRRNGATINIWHDVDNARIKPESFLVVVEISKGSKTKYELDKETGMLLLDRILYTSTHYPACYGFIPKTLAEDDDPLDVLLLCSEPIVPMALVKAYPIGVISMIDDGYTDDKIIAIPFDDPTYNGYRDIDSVPPHVVAEMQHFFAVYKQLENKTTAVDEPQGFLRAIAVVSEAIDRYRQMFG